MEIVREREEIVNELLAYAESCKNTKLFTDVCIKTGNKSLHAHRLILSCYFGYFRTRFMENMEQHSNSMISVEINHERVNATSLESLVDFVYSGKICINQKNVLDLLATSDYLQIDRAKQFCFDYLESNISVETCGEALKIAVMYQNAFLLNKSLKCICSNFKQSSFPNEINLLSKGYLLDFLAMLNEEHVEQHFIYEVIIGWIKHNMNRRDVFAELFRRLDLKKISSTFLANTVSNEILVKENRVCSNLVMNTLAMELHKHVSSNAETVLSIGGQNTRNKVFSVYNDNQCIYPSLPQAVDSNCSLQLDGFVYCIGGWKVVSSTAKVWRMKLNEPNTEWEKFPSMMIDRSVFGAAVYQNGIASVGGSTRRARKSAEFYDFSLNQWKALAPMNNCRSYNALVTCMDCLFCIGGYAEGKSLTSVEKLSGVDEIWQDVQSMQTPRCEFASVNCLGKIYAIGGYSDQFRSIKSVEKYDPVFNMWTYVNDMNFERCGHSACVMQDKIYVVGGKNAKNEYVSEIECYDPLSGNWSTVGRTDEKLFRHSIVAV